MSNSLIFAIVASVTIHFFVLFYSTRIPLKEPPKSNPIAETKKDTVKRMEVRLLPKEQALDTPVTMTTKDPKASPKKSYPTDSIICSGKDKNYKGIGVIYNPVTGVIFFAPTYYPAYQAGLRVGDMILSPEAPYTDEYVDIQYVRPNGDDMRQSIVRIKPDNICFAEDK